MNVSNDVSIASIGVSSSWVAGNKKDLIFLNQMKRENLRKFLPQIFQSCTFNRSVTPP
jgi:hypothetical protein